jgi:uncharacterized cupin superfamily protein
MPKIDIAAVPARKGSGYPPPFDAPCAARTRQRLGEAGGIRDFGVNLMRLPPGSWSSQRHWHSDEDEFVYLLEGEVTLIDMMSSNADGRFVHKDGAPYGES